ncbi:something about silencing protein 10 [Protopterus annectens]|uniref:something about silencing protein 10 n=1 Tax=Protopterus annectens TaxID=7888 RepID=UPI001CF960FC|nr:something about silencing protein 10 [Protopterus annectens]
MDDWMCSINLKNAYHHIKTERTYRRFLHFWLESDHYQFSELPFGLTTGLLVVHQEYGSCSRLAQVAGILGLSFPEPLALNHSLESILSQDHGHLTAMQFLGAHGHLPEVKSPSFSVPRICRLPVGHHFSDCKTSMFRILSLLVSAVSVLPYKKPPASFLLKLIGEHGSFYWFGPASRVSHEGSAVDCGSVVMCNTFDGLPNNSDESMSRSGGGWYLPLYPVGECLSPPLVMTDASLLNADSYYKDEVDDFHDKKIKKLISQGAKYSSEDEEETEEEEVMALNVSDSDDEEEEIDMESDLEEKQDDDLPNEMAWGRKRKMFYDTDYAAEERQSKSKEDLDAEAKEEEEEAQNIQRRLVENLSEEDYGLDFIQAFAKEQDVEKQPEKEQKIQKDLKKMSLKEKLKLLKKESPEFMELIQDFKAKLTELKDELQPLVDMVKDGRIPPGKGANYLEMKTHLYLNYCINISFYVTLKAKRIPVHNHPVIERLVTYRNLINDLKAVDMKLSSELRLLLTKLENDKTNQSGKEDFLPKIKNLAVSSSKQSTKEKKKVGTTPAEVGPSNDSDFDEEAALKYYKEMEEKLKLKKKRMYEESDEKEAEEEEVDPDAKRAITYQIAKNKGLTPKRKKIDRNPRVKHREKYRRAKIRRKGQVREVRTEEHRYTGELSGIRIGVKKSTKLK